VVDVTLVKSLSQYLLASYYGVLTILFVCPIHVPNTCVYPPPVRFPPGPCYPAPVTTLPRYAKSFLKHSSYIKNANNHLVLVDANLFHAESHDETKNIAWYDIFVEVVVTHFPSDADILPPPRQYARGSMIHAPKPEIHRVHHQQQPVVVHKEGDDKDVTVVQSDHVVNIVLAVGAWLLVVLGVLVWDCRDPHNGRDETSSKIN
jgi:hypothetical protein